MSAKKTPDVIKELQEGAASAFKDTPDSIVHEGVTYYRETVAHGDPDKIGAKAGYTRVAINCAPHAVLAHGAAIRLDDRLYFNGRVYEFKDETVPTLMEIMFNTWRHERATGGANVANQGSFGQTFNARSGMSQRHVGPVGVPGM